MRGAAGASSRGVGVAPLHRPGRSPMKGGHRPGCAAPTSNAVIDLHPTFNAVRAGVALQLLDRSNPAARQRPRWSRATSDLNLFAGGIHILSRCH
jgi:hypothetical protein